MEFNVSQLLREPLGSRSEYQVDEQVRTNDDMSVDVRGDVSLLRTDRSILVHADLASEIEVDCSRCLTPMRLPVDLAIEEEYYPTVDIVTGAPLPLPEEPGTFLLDEHHVLDLGEAIRQYLLLAEPMQAFCRPDCAGLCPECGADRNVQPCGCSTELVDERWLALNRLEKSG